VGRHRHPDIFHSLDEGLNQMIDTSLILNTLGSGVPVILLHAVMASAMFAGALWLRVCLTPFDELAEIQAGNSAAAINLSGVMIALAVPLASTLVTSAGTLDVAVWGLVTVAVQLVFSEFAGRLFIRQTDVVRDRNAAGAIALASAQLSLGLLNAGALAL
jgi:putative membrane protein